MPLTFTWSYVEPEAPGVTEEDASTAALIGANLPRDYAINLETRELDFTGGGLHMTSGAEAVAQSLALRFGLFKEEWFSDLDAGTPWLEDILVKAPQAEVLRAIFRERILETTGVSDVEELDVDYDGPSRSLAVSFRVATDYGELSATLEGTP